MWVGTQPSNYERNTQKAVILNLENIHLTERGPRVSQLEQIRDLVELPESPVQILSGVSRRDAETSARHQYGHGRESDHDHGESPLETLAGEGGDLRGIVKHYGHDRTVVVAEDVQAHVGKAHAEVVGIVPQGVEFLPSDVRSIFSHYDLS